MLTSQSCNHLFLSSSSSSPSRKLFAVRTFLISVAALHKQKMGGTSGVTITHLLGTVSDRVAFP
jgi:hypothetical protein